jgi:hypothetical protein
LKKAGIIAAVAIIVVVAAVVFMMMSRDSKPSGFEAANGNLVISGSFAMTVPLSEISELELTNTMPSVTKKTNGAWLGDNCKGEFLLENNIKARLYADISAPTFITFMFHDTVFYVNTGYAPDTESLYNQLKDNIK